AAGGAGDAGRPGRQEVRRLDEIDAGRQRCRGEGGGGRGARRHARGRGPRRRAATEDGLAAEGAAGGRDPGVEEARWQGRRGGEGVEADREVSEKGGERGASAP